MLAERLRSRLALFRLLICGCRRGLGFGFLSLFFFFLRTLNALTEGADAGADFAGTSRLPSLSLPGS
jgi:hypothetical protein